MAASTLFHGRQGFWSRMSAWCTTAFVNFKHRIGFCVFELFRRIDEDFGGNPIVVWWVNNLNKSPCSMTMLMLLQHDHCTFCHHSFWTFCLAVHNLTMCIRALFPKFATTLGLAEQTFWRMPLFTEWNGASLWGDPCRAIETFHQLGLLPLGLRVLDTFLSFCRMKELGDAFGCVTFPRFFISWRKLQLSPKEHCPLAFHCQQSPGVLCPRCFITWFLTTAFVWKFPFLATQFLIRSNSLLMNLPIIQFQYGLEFLKLSCS